MVCPIRRRGPVSIPFKRESVSKDGKTAYKTGSLDVKFQFPSNGKAYPKYQIQSIPHPSNVCFNSLQTGKRIQSEIPYASAGNILREFQFPSNGKAYPKQVKTKEGSSLK